MRAIQTLKERVPVLDCQLKMLRRCKENLSLELDGVSKQLKKLESDITELMKTIEELEKGNNQ